MATQVHAVYACMLDRIGAKTAKIYPIEFWLP